MSTIHNTQCPESWLMKKSNSSCYHAIRKAVAMGELLTGNVKTDENPADSLTKVVGGGQKGRTWCKCTYMIYMMVGNYCPS